MDKEQDDKELQKLDVVNFITLNGYVPLSIKQDGEGNIILNNRKNPALAIKNDLSGVEYNGKSYPINFDENGKVSSPIREALAEAKEAPAIRASELREEIGVEKRKEPIKEMTPQKKAMPDQNVAVAKGPIERLEKQKEKEKVANA